MRNSFLPAIALLLCHLPLAGQTPRPLFDGTTLDGWEGDTKLWRVENGSLIGGSTTQVLKHNDFLATTKDYGNFILRVRLKLTGSGFVNSGVQIRSQRVPGSSEMRGYQCDYGDPTWWGSIYDESRRNKVMAQSDMAKLDAAIKRNDWNDYTIRAEGPRIQTWINGIPAVDYTEAEPEEEIPQVGKIGIQIHSGGKAIIEAKDITIEELPPSPKKPAFQEPKAPEMRDINAGPLSPAEQQKTFHLPPGFSIELVASEEPGIGKFITAAWDAQGRLWSMTALEYPVDANENRPAAEALYASKAKDKVVYYEPGSTKATVFADGLAIPLGMLPYKDGAIVQHGKEIVFLRDTDGDGKADKRETLLEGVGIDDSHLFLHGFTRGPGNWIYTAQGAFNHSVIKAKDGSETKWSFCKLARFKPDGSQFELVAAGLNNIWGFVIDRQGLLWGQEANDMGYPITELAVGDNFPGIGNEKLKPYAPVRPKAVTDWQVGGTGLSGLALQEDAVWPAPYGPAAGSERPFYLANPITNRIQATQAIPDGKGHFRFAKVRDFIRSSDPWFRPVNINFGPDGCLYIVDWYNKIISHNEVPRNHPERDKERGRIWRVKHQDQPPAAKTRWQEKRDWEKRVDKGDPGMDWPQIDLRWQLQSKTVAEMAPLVKAADGSYDTDFTNYMVRAALESRGSELAKFLATAEAANSPEFVLLASQTLDGREAAKKIAQLLPSLKRDIQAEELVRLAEFSEEPSVSTALASALAAPKTLELLLSVKNRLDAGKLSQMLAKISTSLLSGDESLALRLVTSFRLLEMEPQLAAQLEKSANKPAVLAAMAQLGSVRPALFLPLASSTDAKVREEAVLCLATSPADLWSLWPGLDSNLRKKVLVSLTNAKPGAAAFVAALQNGTVEGEMLDGPMAEKLQAVLGEQNKELEALLNKMGDLFRPVLLLDGKDKAFAKSNLTLDGPFTVETWVRLDPKIGNADSILAAPGVADFNFYDGKFRVWVDGLQDVIIAKKPVSPDLWTHVCVTRDAAGQFRIYLNGELDQAESRADQRPYKGLQIGLSNVPQGTGGAFTEFRVWNAARSAQEIRTNFDRVLAAGPGLLHRFSGKDWPALSGTARIAKTTDFPSLMTTEQAAAMDEKFAKFTALAREPGDAAIGKNLAVMCTSCHVIGEAGGKIGPNLSGVGAMGIDAILRNILTPNAAMEAGYRVYQVQLIEGTVKEGFLAQEDEQAIILRLPGLPDERIAKSKIRQAKHLKRSLMPEGLVDNLPPEMVRHLLAYLQGLK